MMRPLLIPTLLLALAPGLACAQAAPASSAAPAAQALDLKLPKGSANMAPGTWYGDVSGKPARPQAEINAEARAQADAQASRCPTSPDGKPNPVTGSVAMGVGTASHYGTSTYTAADVNVCKDYIDDNGGHHLMNLNIGVGQSNGPNGGRYRGW